MKNHSIAVRSVTVAAAAALSLGVAAPIMPAYAADGQAYESNGLTVSDSTIDATAKGSLTIFKKADPKETHTSTGEVDSSATGTSLDGVEFTLYKVPGYDLTKNDQLVKASNLKVSDVKPGEGDVVSVQTTANGGKATWTDLPVGVYYLRETKPAEGYSPAADSLVFVPMTRNNDANTGGGTQWLYDITAYPKNRKNTNPEKSVTDTGKNVGDKVTYTVDTYAQYVDPDTQYRTFYRVEDNLDPALSTTADKVTVASTPNREFVKDKDYTVSVAKVDGRDQVLVKFTKEGIAKIDNGDKITVTIEATVNSKPGNGDLKNVAQHYENNPNDSQEHDKDGTPPETPKNTPEIHTFFGDLEFTKVNSTGKGLKDAEFKVFGIKGDQTCAALDTKNLGENAKEQTAAGKTTWVSDDTGKVTITGLHANNIANWGYDAEKNQFTTANEWTSYCLVETKSPAGYELLAQPIEFKINANRNEAGVWTVANGSVKVGNTDNQVVNLEDSTPKLPLTGGMGIGILAALGALIIAAGAYSAKRRSA
ncbi:SpaH/EbpB family LPXTG-anchored major pilin [Corynebacterium bouchesdurhonense]|uniref:SpaH/EbpB family LPXTG-anchored major pilin n=1 Tax=Corynebacterium bouchesdurhonense TaxID=1720192 RepID=UPI00082E0D64|nr:SpaH/EbpB family LPXTG-anchored major pilin [Corynebacterium bouchesdurhonense]